MDASFGYWLSGFVDGEGHFGLYDSRSTPGTLPIAEFCIKLRDDDKAVLELIQKELQIGRICTIKSIYKDKDQTKFVINRKDQTKFAVNRRDDLLQIVKLFDEYPLKSKKQNDYKIWRQAVIILNSPSPSKDYLLELAGKLKEARKYPSTSIQCLPQPMSAQLSFL